eukprot:TRINITY_DN14002_c0_g1_i3.p1 TRINITY_DN14002_c0_g1~~TRINITY_DN14002_c0_g1_i3.p1  ORF type:complete len:225 (-),score=64.16 TRINITY_DN14002_c0_g1_i3:756-1430(-)
MASPRAADSAGSCEGQMSQQPAAATAAALLVAAAVGAALDRKAPRRTVAAVAAAAIQACLQAGDSKCAVLGSSTEASVAKDPSGARRRRGGKRGDRRRRRRAAEATAEANSQSLCAGSSSGLPPKPLGGKMPVVQPGATARQSGQPTGTAEKTVTDPLLRIRAGGRPEKAPPPGLAPETDSSQQHKKPPWLQAALDADGGDDSDDIEPYQGSFYADEDPHYAAG